MFGMALSERALQPYLCQTNSVSNRGVTTRSMERDCDEAVAILRGTPSLNPESFSDSSEQARELSGNSDAEGSGKVLPNPANLHQGNSEQQLSSQPRSARNRGSDGVRNPISADQNIESRDLNVGGIDGNGNPELEDNAYHSLSGDCMSPSVENPGLNQGSSKRNSCEDNRSVADFQTQQSVSNPGSGSGAELPVDATGRGSDVKLLNRREEGVCAARLNESHKNQAYTVSNSLACAGGNTTNCGDSGDSTQNHSCIETFGTDQNLDSNKQYKTAVDKIDEHLKKEIPKLKNKHDNEGTNPEKLTILAPEKHFLNNTFTGSFTYTKKKTGLDLPANIIQQSEDCNHNNNYGHAGSQELNDKHGRTRNRGNIRNDGYGRNDYHGNIPAAGNHCSCCHLIRGSLDQQNSPNPQVVPQISVSERKSQRVVDLSKKSLKYLNIQLGTKPYDNNWTCIAELRNWKNTRIKSFAEEYRGKCFEELLFVEEFNNYEVSDLLRDLKKIKRNDLVDDFNKNLW